MIAYSAIARIVSYLFQIYNLIMSSAMDYATTNTSLNSWAKTYMFQVLVVYTRIETVGLAVNGVLTGPSTLSPGFDVAGDRAKVLAIHKAMLLEFGTYKSAENWAKKMVLKHIDQNALCSSGVGKAFLKQLELVAPFSSAMDREFKKDPNYKSITSSLKAYLQSTGKGVNSIRSMRTWLEMNTITSILHGSALSLLRLIGTQSIMSVNSFDSPTFTTRDSRLWRVFASAPLETRKEFYAFSDQIPSVNPYNINKVIQIFTEKTAALKDLHQEEITEDEEEYKKFGWILSDYGPNWKDGKQLSYTGYF